MDYRDIIESRYNREAWQQLLHDIFRNKVSFWREPSVVHASSRLAKQALNLGKISLADGESIAIYEIELTDNVDIERNRRGIRDMLTTDWRNMGYAGAFMFCYRQNESVLRFSYVSESWSFADDGTYKKDSTDTRRFTYLLGEGHRSRTAIQQFEGLKKSNLSLKDLTKAFSVDAVSDMFFDDYKQQYEDIIAFITGKRMVKVSNKWEERVVGEPNETIFSEFLVFTDPEKAIRDYVKKLMGRLVFLQFLQKKGWLGVPVNAQWGDGDREFIQHLFDNAADKDTFVDNVLEPLFNDINSERKGDIASPAVGKDIRVPYLNGGLFEPDAADAVDFPLPAKYMKSMLDFFASYNFTIDENDPDDAEMGVDPEMLGRIFENLLEDNKDKGAFYTPKEIVGYMCRESLIAYLQTDITDDAHREAIRQFVTTHKQVENLPDNVLQKLIDVKICDPAIGSGAFPMGLLKELYLCRAALEGFDQKKAAEIKKHIMQQNIYGVDIERGAVDTARLRFWLALIVDEESPEALPNLDFKIMQGNSLLEQYKGTDLSNTTEKKISDDGMFSIFDDMLDVYRKELRRLLTQYFDCADHKKKLQLRKDIVANVKKQLSEQGTECKFGELDIVENDQFFMWHTWFYDVFSQGGFDIVIGNPPYVFARNSEEKGFTQHEKEIYYTRYKLAKYQINLYHLFVELGCNLLSINGIFAYIIPNNWMTINTNKEFREYILSKSNIKITNFYKKVFKSADVDNSILIFSSASDHTSTVSLYESVSTDRIELIREISIKMLLSQKDYIINIELFKNNRNISILEKIEKASVLLNTLSSVKCGIKAYQIGKGKPAQTKEIKEARAFHSTNKISSDYYVYVEGVDVKRYALTWVKKEFIKYGSHLAEPRKNWRLFSSERILVRQIPSRPPYCINAVYTDDIIINDLNSMNIIDIQCKPLFLLAILNSRVTSYWFVHKFGKMQRGLFPQFKINELSAFPVPRLSSEQESFIANLAQIILQKKRADPSIDITDEDIEIDNILFDYYKFTQEEISIIKNNE